MSCGADCDRVTVGGRTLEVSSGWKPGEPLFRGRVDNDPVTFRVHPGVGGLTLSRHGRRVRIRVVERRLAPLVRLMPHKQPPDMSKFLLSPMPGLLVRLSVKPGDHVKPGGELAVVEAMKMENILRADQESVVKLVHAEEGGSLATDEKILEFE